MRRGTPLNVNTYDVNPSDDEEHPPHRRGNNLKSGIERTGASMVIHVTWPHKMVYTLEGKHGSYRYLSIPLFVHGFLIIMESEEGPVKELMSTNLQD